MTTIYTTMPVESLDQAKQLPHGTIARIQLDNGDWLVLALSDLSSPKKPGQRFWFGTFSTNAFLDDAVVGGIALIPLEVEDESILDESRKRRKTVFVTDWEEAS